MSVAVAKSKQEHDETVLAGRGLDGLNLFVANIQTGFGPFIAVYLTTQGWTQTAIGTALSLGTITAMASQIPAGALVDAIRNKAAVAFFSIVAFSGSALLLAIRPHYGSMRRRYCTGSRAARSARLLPPSAFSPSDRQCSVPGSGAMPALPRSATGSVPR
jgi:MFS family permease